MVWVRGNSIFSVVDSNCIDEKALSSNGESTESASSFPSDGIFL